MEQKVGFYVLRILQNTPDAYAKLDDRPSIDEMRSPLKRDNCICAPDNINCRLAFGLPAEQPQLANLML